MQNLRLLFVFLCGFSAQTALSQDPDAFSMKEHQLTGPVKSVVTTSFTAQKDATGAFVKGVPGHQYSWEQNTRITYNEKGGVLIAQEILPNGDIFTEIVCDYLNNRLNEVRTRNGLVIFEYDDTGRLSMRGEKSTVSGDEGFYAFMKYEYNEKGLLVKLTETDGEGAWEATTTYTYDQKGNLTNTKERYASEGETITDFQYNSAGQLTRSVLKDDEGMQEVTTFTYDGTKKTEIWSDYEQGVYSGKIVYTYVNDLEVKSVEYDGETIAETQTMTYEFDSSGNWIKKTISVNGKKFFIEERVIAYY